MTPLHADGELFIGLMSGTSLDGVDAVLARFSPPESSRQDSPFEVLAHAHVAMPGDLRSALLQLNQSGDDELHRAALAGNALARLQAAAVQQVRQRAGVPAAAVCAIGSHGQTLRHRPGEFDGVGYTLQLNQPALLAELCGIDVVCDFRSRDVAAGGQGAPLVPAFHATVFSLPDRPRALLNLGGIANLTLLPPGRSVAAVVRGFDCGPGNALLDHWVALHRSQAYDAEGAWAASGKVHAALLDALMDEPFLRKAAPKSTGRDLFNPRWLALRLDRIEVAAGAPLPPQDVQATLSEFTARAAAESLKQEAPDVREVLVCGGGAFNADLMARLRAHLPGVVVQSSEAAGLPPLQVEAAAFAWLARAFVRREPGQRREVTGARGLRVLGALYPAGPLDTLDSTPQRT